MKVVLVVTLTLLLASASALAQPKPGPRPGPRPGPKPGPRPPGTQPATQPAPPADEQIPPDLQQPIVPTPWLPMGFAGESPLAPPPAVSAQIRRPVIPLPDRWRLGWPSWDRYGRAAPFDDVLMNNTAGDSPYTRGDPLNPYDRNVLKGDYPVVGDDVFLSVTALSDTLYNFRRLPTPSGVSAQNANSFDFFEGGRQHFISQTALVSVEMFRGYTAFRPIDWLVRVSGAYNFNYINLQERNITNIDVTKEDNRTDEFAALQEAFFEYHLGDMSPKFDIAAVRAGRQLFVSDFRGFIYNDIADGVRLFGNLASNRIQYNLALFNQLDKDTNSELNELDWRDQQVLIANLFVQDFIWKGYTTQFSFHWNHDQSDQEYDNNGFLVVPDLAGSVNVHNIDAYYAGWTGDGHIGRVNVNHAFYYVFGHDDGNPLAAREVDISAYMGALELSMDFDWFRPKLSFLYASGDSDPRDGTAGGFDGIFDNPFFAGGSSSLFQSQAFRLFGVNLTSSRSLFNDLAGAKTEGQSNYVNPGTILIGAGFDAEITPKLRTSFNANSIWFAQTDALELFLNQPGIDNHFGYELNLTTQYRPFLNNNAILTVGGSVFFPGTGYHDLFEGRTALYQLFAGLTFTY